MKQTTVNIDVNPKSDGFALAGGAAFRTLTVSGADITLYGTGSQTATFPTSSCTLAATDILQTFTQPQFMAAKLTVNAGTAPAMYVRNASGQGYFDIVAPANQSTSVRYFYNSDFWQAGATGTGFTTAYNATTKTILDLTGRYAVGKSAGQFNTGFPSGSVDISGSLAVTGSIRNDDICYPTMSYTYNSAATPETLITIKVNRIDNTQTARNYHLVSWWISSTRWGAPSTLAGQPNITVSLQSGTQIAGTTLPITTITTTPTGLQHTETTSDEVITIGLTHSSATGVAITAYIMAEVQGVLHSLSFLYDTGN